VETTSSSRRAFGDRGLGKAGSGCPSEGKLAMSSGNAREKSKEHLAACENQAGENRSPKKTGGALRKKGKRWIYWGKGSTESRRSRTLANGKLESVPGLDRCEKKMKSAEKERRRGGFLVLSNQPECRQLWGWEGAAH